MLAKHTPGSAIAHVAIPGPRLYSQLMSPQGATITCGGLTNRTGKPCASNSFAACRRVPWALVSQCSAPRRQACQRMVAVALLGGRGGGQDAYAFGGEMNWSPPDVCAANERLEKLGPRDSGMAPRTFWPCAKRFTRSRRAEGRFSEG